MGAGWKRGGEAAGAVRLGADWQLAAALSERFEGLELYGRRGDGRVYKDQPLRPGRYRALLT